MKNNCAICISDFDNFELNSFYIGDFEFKLTCVAFPEQYDVFDAYGVKVAYVRLRQGCLSVDVSNCGDETIYTHNFLSRMGCFKNKRQRIRYLKKIAKILRKERNA